MITRRGGGKSKAITKISLGTRVSANPLASGLREHGIKWKVNSILIINHTEDGWVGGRKVQLSQPSRKLLTRHTDTALSKTNAGEERNMLIVFGLPYWSKLGADHHYLFQLENYILCPLLPTHLIWWFVIAASFKRHIPGFYLRPRWNLPLSFY